MTFDHFARSALFFRLPVTLEYMRTRGGLFKRVRDVGTFLERRGGSNDVQQLEPVRIAGLLREVPGQWVAIRNGEIIEARATPDELIAALRSRSINDATVMRAPTEHEAEYVGIG